MQPLTLRASRWKFGVYLLIALVFAGIGIVMVLHPDNSTVSLQGWLAIVVFGPGALVAAWLIARPLTLSLDGEGLTLTGGLMRRPQRLAWRDIEAFKVFVLPRGGKLVGYNRRRDPLVEASGRLSRFVGIDGAIPGGWAQSVEKTVALLNDYRARALAAPRSFGA